MAKPKVTVEPFVAPSEPEAQPEETVTIDMGNGITRTLVRGSGSNRVSDAVWAEAQRQARRELADKQKDSAGKQGEADAAKANLFNAERVAASEKKAPVAKGRSLTPEEEKVVQRLSPEARTEYLKLLESDAPAEQPKAKSPPPQKTTEKAAPPDAVGSPAPTGNGDRRVTTPEGDVLELQSNAGGSNGLDPRALGGSVANMMMGATPETPSGPMASMPVEGGAGAMPSGAGGGGGTYPEPSKQGSSGPLIDVPAWAKPPPGRDYGLGVPDVMGTLDNMFSPAPAPAPADAGPVQDLGVAPPPVAPVPVGSASASMKLPSGFKIEQVPSDVIKQQKEDAANARSAAEDAQFTLAAQGEAQTNAVRQYAERQKVIEAEAAGLSKLASEAKMTSVQEAQRYQTAHDRVAEEARQAAATPTDPNRFWNNKDAGQKAAGIIAGALFGFTGQGMQWLQHVKSLVDSDNQLQVQDRASKVAGLERQAQSLGEAGQRALQMGATRAEAFLIDRAGKLEGLKSFLDLTTMKLNNAQQRMAGAQMSAQLGAEIAGLGAQGLQLAQQSADSINQARYQNASLAQGAAIASMKSGGEDAQSLKPVQEEVLSGLLNLGDQIGDMATQWEQQAGNPMAAVQSNLGLGMQFTDASKWAGSSAKFHAQTIGKPLEEGRLTDADFPKYLDGFIPKATDTREAAKNKVSNLVKYAVTKYKNKLTTLDAGYVKTRGLPTAEQYEQMLRKRAGLTEQVPAFKETPK